MNQFGTPADSLRRRIDEAEVLVANLRGAGAKALTLLELLDQMDADVATLAGTGMDARAEQSRIETIQAILRKKKGMLLRELRPAGGLERLRAERQPAPKQWWWFLDRDQAEERRRTLLRYGRWALIAAIVLGAAFAVYQRFLRPDPLLVAVYTNQGAAQRYIAAGQFELAMPRLQENMELEPGTAAWPIRLGVLKALAGDQGESEELFEQGRQLAGTELDFLVQRGQFYLEANAHARARDDMLRATELDAQSPVAFFYLGRAYAGLGDSEAALRSYESAATFANQQRGNETIYVMARLEMAQLLQDAGMPTQ